MCEFLTDKTHSHRILGAAQHKLEQVLNDTSLSAFRHEDARASIVAIDGFQRGWNALRLGGLDFIAPPKMPLLQIEGVQVAVGLDAVAKIEGPNKPAQVGGALLRMARGGSGETEGAAAKRREIGRNAAVLVYMSVAANLAKAGKPTPDICYSIDVQHQEAHQAPKNYLAIVENMNAACRTIAALWDSAKPPGGK